MNKYKERLKEIKKERDDLIKQIQESQPLIVKLGSRYLDTVIFFGTVVLFWTFIFYGAINKIYGTNISFSLDNIIGLDKLIDILPRVIEIFMELGYNKPYVCFVTYLIIIYAWLLNPLIETIGDYLKEEREWKTNYLDIFNLFGLSYFIENKLKTKDI